MARHPRILKSDLSIGIAVGLGLGSIAVRLAPRLRPVAKQAVRAGMLVLASGRIWAFEVRDSIEDLVSGVRPGDGVKQGGVPTAAPGVRPTDSG